MNRQLVAPYQNLQAAPEPQAGASHDEHQRCEFCTKMAMFLAQVETWKVIVANHKELMMTEVDERRREAMASLQCLMNCISLHMLGVQSRCDLPCIAARLHVTAMLKCTRVALDDLQQEGHARCRSATWMRGTIQVLQNMSRDLA